MAASQRRWHPRLDNLSLRDQLGVDRLGGRLAQMMIGLTGFGLSLAMLLRSGLGGAPWDVFHAALAERLGIGTVANAIWVGVSIDLGMLVLPQASSLPVAIALMLLGVVVNGISGAVYIGAQLGAGARDGLMTALSRVLSRPVGPVRIVLEVIVLVTGRLLGGPLGLGTVVYAIALGPVIQLALPHVLIPVRSVRGREPGAAR